MELTQTLRSLARRPSVTLAAVLVAALALAAATTTFALVHRVLLDPLPFPEAERLVHVWNRYDSLAQAPLSPPGLDDWRGSEVFSEIAAWWQGGAVLAGSGPAERLDAVRTTASLFPLLGVEPVHGRTFEAAAETPGGESVALLGHALWHRRFAADPGVVGRRIEIDGEPHTVLGVLPAGFSFPGESELWLPLALTPEQLADENRGSEFLTTLARLAPGVSLEAARAAVDTRARTLVDRVPARREFLVESGWGLTLVPLREQLTGRLRPALVALTGAVALLLLVACVNLAGLGLARIDERRREMAVHTALGAPWRRLLVRLLLESLTVAAAGGAAGTLAAWWLLDLLGRRLPQAADTPLPSLLEARLDPPTVAFAAGLTLVLGLVAGLSPAWSGSRVEAAGTLVHGGSGGSAPRQRLQGALVAAQVGLAVLLLAGAGVLLKSFDRLAAVDPGFDSRGVLSARLTFDHELRADPERRRRFARRLLERLEASPRIETAALTRVLPMSGASWTRSFAVEGQSRESGENPAADFRPVTPGYFASLGVPLVAGRTFAAGDAPGSPPVAVVDERMAERFWDDGSPLGRRIGFFDGENDSVVWREVVGVVGHTASRRLDEEGRLQIYVPYFEMPMSDPALLVRAAGADPVALVPLVRRTVAEIAPGVPVSRAEPLAHRVSASIAGERFRTVLVTAFAVLALLLAAAGLYGMIAYTVSRRRREVGIRLALGAGRAEVLRSVAGRGLAATAAGLALGLAAAPLATRALSGLLYEVSPGDPAILAAVAVALAAVAVLASLLPARRALAVDPALPLREG